MQLATLVAAEREKHPPEASAAAETPSLSPDVLAAFAENWVQKAAKA